MDHADHVNLLRPAKLTGGVYADFGAGSGAFTLALRELVGISSTIYAIDKNKSSLRELESAYHARFNSTENLALLPSNFSHNLDIPPLDGIIAANSIHYFKDRIKILKHIKLFLKPNGILIVVEYNVDKGNPWVPYPFSFETFRKFAVTSGYSEPRLLAKNPSNFLQEFYSALTYLPSEEQT